MLNYNWLGVSASSNFSIHNLPFGIFSEGGGPKKAGIAIGDSIIDLSIVSESGIFTNWGFGGKVFLSGNLNDFISLGKSITNGVRTDIQNALCTEDHPLRELSNAFIAQSKAVMHLPVHVGDYTDFYSSIEHATNVGKMFRDPENALLPNWKHLPVGYHGRASSIIESGRPVNRPCGQIKPPEGPPIYSPSRRMDFELEMAFIVGKDSELGEPVGIHDAMDHIFGMVLFNDWSARDIQKWEYVPLGPFLGKSFASSISPWVVTMEALNPFLVDGPVQDPKVLSYLKQEGPCNYDIALQVDLIPEGGEPTMICQSNYKYMYWSMCQQLAHHTVNGCNIRVGDLMASGTISGPDPGSFGSMLELSWGGKQQVKLTDGTNRTFLEDGDTVVMKGFAEKGDIRVGFGEVSSQLLPAHPMNL
jgi:fumarylacetoacetase